MEIISLLPFFIFLLFVILTIYRTKKKLKDLRKPDRNKPNNLLLKSEKYEKEEKSGWKNILIDTYEQIQREIKTAQEQKQAQYKIPEKVLEKPKPTVLWEKDISIPSPPPLPSLKEIKKKKTALSSQKPDIAKMSEAKVFKTPPAKKSSLKNLRKAVVWAEILAPPLALRKKHDL
jgi:hypothetical protein